MDLKEFKSELRLTSDGDNWGNAMGTWFECAGQVNKRGLIVPWHWEYRPGMGSDGTDPESYYYPLFENTDKNDLFIIGEFLCRYCQYLDFKGLSY